MYKNLLLLKVRHSMKQIKNARSVVSIVAKEGVTVSREKLQEAIDVMVKTAEDILGERGVCTQISSSQMTCLINRNPSEEQENSDAEKIMKEILLYFYKINEVGDFKIEYEIESE